MDLDWGCPKCDEPDSGVSSLESRAQRMLPILQENQEIDQIGTGVGEGAAERKMDGLSGQGQLHFEI